MTANPTPAAAGDNPAMTWPLQSQMKEFYGDPDASGDGVADRRWEIDNLERITPPYRMVLAWDKTRVVSSIAVHRKCASSLMRILTNIAEHFGSEQLVEANRMHLYGGCYNFRMMRGSTRLSTHAYAAAIDLDPEANPLGMRYKESAGMMPMAVVKIFEAEGWVWGGRWKRADAQHFQAARIS